MAIYHFSAQVISRSQGRSSVAASAYRAAEKIHDERTGTTHDFTSKSDVVEKTILLPKNAPEAFKNRETLWNAVEQSEKRKDAQVAREINIALPRELTHAQNWALVKEFAQKQFVEQGMIADVTFHRGHLGSEEQPHAHIMLTMRSVSEAGFGPKVREWNAKAILENWREQWAEHCNHALSRAGLDIQIDHRTLEAQGIDLEPQTKIGPKARETSMVRFQEHQALARRNGERLLADPQIALQALTQQQSTFTHQDLARFVNRHTVDAAQFKAVTEKIQLETNIVKLGQDAKGRDRFTTQAMLSIEQKMLSQSAELSHRNTYSVSEPYVNLYCNKGLTDEQFKALHTITSGQNLNCLLGYAGTGKSRLLGFAREVWEDAGYRVQGMALAGKAAEGLEAGSGIQSQTVASRLWCWEQGIEKLTERDVVVVDEAGMLGSAQMGHIVSKVHQANAKLVLVGDPEQLQAIEAGGAYRAISDSFGFCLMSEVHRQQADWQKDATVDFANQRTREGLLAYENHDNLHFFQTRALAMRKLLEQWDEVRSQSPEKSQMMLAYTRDEVKDLNEQAREMRHAQGELGPDITCDTARGTRQFATGDRVYFLKNEHRDLQVKNGTLGTIEQVSEQKMHVRLDPNRAGEQRCVEFKLSDYNHLDHGYAATIHKAQGVTVDRAHVLASQYFDRHSTYVAMSRHRDGADLYVSRSEFSSFNRLVHNLSRDRTKDISLDYAQNRCLDIEESKRLSDRSIEPSSTYAMTLTPDRLKAAGDRLEQRASELEIQQKQQALIKAAEKRSGLSFDFEIKAGDQGQYLGLVQLGDQYYGAIEQSKGHAKLIHRDCLDSQEVGKQMHIESSINQNNETVFRAIQPDVIQFREARQWMLDVNHIQDCLGRPVSFTYSAGDRGIYRGLYQIGSECYGLMEQGDQLKAIPESCLLSKIKGQTMVVESREDVHGKSILVADQSQALDAAPVERDQKNSELDQTKALETERQSEVQRQLARHREIELGDFER